MENSVYIMLSRQTALFRDMDMTANNIANIDTGGFQGEKMMFAQHLEDDGNHRKMAFPQDRSSYLNTDAGPLEETGAALDAAISGPGYFEVQTANGTRYTRNGSFRLDQEGFLTTQRGDFVLDDGGQRIQFEPNAQDIRIGEGGNISVDNQPFTTLAVVQFANRQDLEHESGSTFRSNAAPLPADNSRVMQGVLEKSNVEGVREIVDMTEIQRNVGNTAKFIEIMYDLQRKASNTYAQSN